MNDTPPSQPVTTLESGRVSTEGDTLYYEVRGQGQPLLMIPPGGGDGWQYAYVAEILSDAYKVICYDRRGNGRSTMNDPQNFEVSQQSRDAVAVLQAVGESAAIVFGNSSGAVIALDMAKTQPQAVTAIIAHEPPIARIHPQHKKWQRFFGNVYAMSFRYGSALAALRFIIGIRMPIREIIKPTQELNLHKKNSSEPYIDSRATNEYLIKQELIPITNYLPDVQAIQKNGVKVILAAGKDSLDKKRFYAETAPIMAEQLACDMMIFPGHHGSYLDKPQEFAAALRQAIRKVQ